jgi:sterol desaturase/sphingolipid hydroxylase (fatty acid hydroxylase superfamily)
MEAVTDTLHARISYYGDFVAYPAALTALLLIHAGTLQQHAMPSLAALAGGLLLWTLLEYCLHRWALHRMPIFTALHAAHHSAPRALISTPPWISIPVWLGAVLLPLWIAAGPCIAVGTTLGVMLGYWYYGIVHHVIHHRVQGSPSSPLALLRAWHLRHHYCPARGNFGVTSPIWDYVFGTAIEERRAVSERRLA